MAIPKVFFPINNDVFKPLSGCNTKYIASFSGNYCGPSAPIIGPGKLKRPEVNSFMPVITGVPGAEIGGDILAPIYLQATIGIGCVKIVSPFLC